MDQTFTLYKTNTVYATKKFSFFKKNACLAERLSFYYIYKYQANNAF